MSLVCLDDFEEKAGTLLEKKALDYYKGGAGEEFSLGINREAFRRYIILHKILEKIITFLNNLHKKNKEIK